MKFIRFFIFEKSIRKRGLFFVCRQVFVIIFPFIQGERTTFFCCPLLDFGQGVKKKVPKKKLASLLLDRLYRAINCAAPSFSVPDGTVPQNSASVVRKAKRLEIVGSRTNGFDLMARVRVGATSREPRNATLCGNAFHDSWELSLVWEQVGASTNLRTFPHHDLAPNGLLQG